jgi:outer membrane protease
MRNIAVSRSFVSLAAAFVIFLSGCASVEQWWDFPEGGITGAEEAAQAEQAAAQTKPDAEDEDPPAVQAAGVPPSAQSERNYTFSVSPQGGLLWGQGEEQVYRDSSSDDLLSQLLWDMKPLWYLGAALDFSQREPSKKWGGFATLSAKFGIPAETGSMEDRDWQAPGPELTNYSWHNNNTESAIILDLTGGINIPLKSLFVLRFSLGLSYLHFSWAARDGYYLYGIGTDRYGSVSGAVISYSQDWLLLPFGVSFAILPGSRFSGSLHFSAGPALIFIGRDTHHRRNLMFLDNISGGYTLEPGAELLFSPHERVSLGLHFSWRSITASPHGESYYATLTGGSPGDFVYLDNLAGGLFQTLDLGLGVKIHF